MALFLVGPEKYRRKRVQTISADFDCYRIDFERKTHWLFRNPDQIQTFSITNFYFSNFLWKLPQKKGGRHISGDKDSSIPSILYMREDVLTDLQIIHCVIGRLERSTPLSNLEKGSLIG
jgi:hypothetical protein